MVETKGAAVAVKNYEDAIASVPGKYEQGVNAASNVIAKSKAAEGLWKEKVIDAANREARSRGLDKVSDADWKNAALTKGKTRIGDGMRAAKPKFQRGITEVISVIEGTSIADRTADPEANVDNRVKPIVRALHDHFKG